MNLCWGAAPAVGKWVMQETQADPLSMACVRYLSGLVAMLWWARSSTVEFWKSAPSTRALVVTMGALTFGFGPILAFSGLALTAGGQAAFLIGLEPVLTALFAFLILAEKMQKIQILGLALGLAGVTWMSYGGAGGSLQGNMMFLADVAVNALYSVLGTLVVRRGFAVKSLTTAAMASGVAVLLFTIPDFSLLKHWQAWVGGVLFLGVLCTSIGYSVWIMAARRVPLGLLALTLFVQPLSGNIVAFLMLGEIPTWHVLGGGTLILITMALSARTAMRG